MYKIQEKLSNKNILLQIQYQKLEIPSMVSIIFSKKVSSLLGRQWKVGVFDL